MVKYVSSKYLELEKISQNVNISTISATCGLGTILVNSNKFKLVENIAKTNENIPKTIDIIIKGKIAFEPDKEKKFKFKNWINCK